MARRHAPVAARAIQRDTDHDGTYQQCHRIADRVDLGRIAGHQAIIGLAERLDGHPARPVDGWLGEAFDRIGFPPD